jgi:hypothetical protein
MSRGTKLKRMTEHKADLSRLPSLAIPSLETLNDPASLFLHLTSWTVPHGGEERYYGAMLTHLGFTEDGIGNWWLNIPLADGKNSATCFMSHLDTCDWDAEPITRFVDNGVCSTNGKTILGADDRAGVAVLLYLATRDVPGLYYLFIGEEKGCVGSSMAAERGYLEDHHGNRIERCISFDRKGTTSVVTHQCGRQTCSREFAWALSNELNAYGLAYEPDSGGVFTDSREFADTVPECTNLSVGYYDMHSFKERQDLKFLKYLCEVAVGIDWEGLPTVRVPDAEDDWFSGRYDTGYGYYDDSVYAKADYSDADAFEAMDELVENFLEGLPADTRVIDKMVMSQRQGTIEMIELLLEDLQRQVRRRNDEPG